MKTRKFGILKAAALVLLGAVLLGGGMIVGLNRAMMSRQKTASEEKLAYVDTLLDEMNEKKAAEEAAFDELNTSKADTVAFMARNIDGFAMTDEHMAELRDIIDVYNLLIIDRDGQIVCSALESPRDYSISRFNQLRAVWTGSESAEPFTIDTDDISLRYYGAKIDSTYMVVVVRDTAVLQQKLESVASLSAALDGIRAGREGFVFAVSPLDYSFLYYPDESYIGQSAVACGIDAALLEDGVSAYLTVDGTRYYCSTALLDDTYIVCAVPAAELTANRSITAAVTVVLYLIAAAIVVLYIFFTERDKKARAEQDFRRAFVGRLLAISAAGVVCVGVLTFFLMTLLSLSQQGVTNKHRLDETVAALEAAEKEKTVIGDQFDESYLEKAHLLADVIEEAPVKALTQTFMAELADALDAERICYFDTDGNTVAASDSYWGLRLSENEEDQTYAFRKILAGSVSEVVQEAMAGDDGVYCQYIGVAIQDASHKTVGVAQLGITPSLLESALSATDLGDVLSEIQTGNNGFVFAVDSEDGTFTYYPDESLVGWEAVSYGLGEEQLITGYNDLISVSSETYYAISGEYGSNLIFVAVPMRTLNNMSAPAALAACLFCVIWLALLLAVLVPGVGPLEAAETQPPEDGGKDIIRVDRGDGKKIRTRSILTRFTAKDPAWAEYTAGQKVWLIVKLIVGAAAVCLLIMLLAADSIFSEDSLIRYILKGTWQKGINVFAVTQCAILIISVELISVIVRRLLLWFADKLGAKGDTIIRLLVSFIKLATVVGLIYVCLAQLGADTTVLLTSAGILSLVVGLGANSLIKDILAGLMIVFEGAFQVGDIVTINGFRGTVVEIGIRTTKVKEAGGNIKIFDNSSVGDVLNMTKDFSVVAVDMSIEYGEDLCFVENVLAKEFDAVRAALPAIKDGPFYKGVSELGDNSVNIKIVAKCDEADRAQLDRDLKRELKLIFDRYDINIPFPQVVLNQPPASFHHANVSQQEDADEFGREQTEESQDIVIDGET